MFLDDSNTIYRFLGRRKKKFNPTALWRTFYIRQNEFTRNHFFFFLFCFSRQYICGERGAGRPVDQRPGHSGVGRRHTRRSTGLAAGVPVPVVPVDPVLSGHRANHGRGGRRKLRPALPDARVLRQTDRHENHHAPVRHMDRQLHTGHVAVHIQNGTGLLRKTGTASVFV